MRSAWILVAMVGLASNVTERAWAQPLGAQLSTLLTQQGPAPPGFVIDTAAAEATFASVAGLLLVELTSLPATTSSGGFVYRLNRTLGTIERASENFGPFYTERALRSGARQLSLGLTFQSSDFSSLQGASLEAGTFPTNAARFAGNLNPFSVDTLALDLDARTVTGHAHYGVSDQLDVGVLVPVVSLKFRGTRVNTFNGQQMFEVTSAGSASGIGDLTVTTRYQVHEQRGLGVALGTDLRFPTGDSAQLLGTGDTSVRAMIIGSWESGRLAAHVNGGLAAGGVTGEVFWNGAVALAVAPRFTVVGELLGRNLRDLNHLSDVYQPHPVLAGVETMRWLPRDPGVSTSYVATGVKWNPSASVVVNASLLVRLTDAGLRSRVTPGISIDYAIQR